MVIAEVGVNHNGSLSLAIELVDVAKKCGADIVKFQTFKSELLTSKNANMAEYQKVNTGKSESQLEMLKRLELSEADQIELAKVCRLKNIRFLSTGFDLYSLNFLRELNHGLWKIPSGEITNLPYLEYIGKLNQTVYLSTGMSTLQEVSAAIDVLTKNGTDKNNITVMQCTTEYPAGASTLNLNAMRTMAKELGVKVGFSDHSLGSYAAIAAVALGARVIEKHITLDKNLEGPDHKASMEPADFEKYVKDIQDTSVALGDGVKYPHIVEEKNISIVRKSLVAAVKISKGEKFTNLNLTTKRPGSGISPMKYYQLIGRSALRDYAADELIDGDLENVK